MSNLLTMYTAIKKQELDQIKEEWGPLGLKEFMEQRVNTLHPMEYIEISDIIESEDFYVVEYITDVKQNEEGSILMTSEDWETKIGTLNTLHEREYLDNLHKFIRKSTGCKEAIVHNVTSEMKGVRIHYYAGNCKDCPFRGGAEQ